jgi:ADP-heptose:LPS heptosyltransferase
VGAILKSIAGRVLATYLRPPKTSGRRPLSSVSNLLILRDDALGDAVVTTPVWRMLKRLKPNIHIGVLASRANRELLEGDPDIDAVYCIPEVAGSETVGQIRSVPWDVVLCFRYNSKTKSAMLAHRLAPKAFSSTVAFKDVAHYRRLFSIVSPQSRTGNPHMTEIIARHLSDTIDIEIDALSWHPSLNIPQSVERDVHDRVWQQLDGLSSFVHLNLHASIASREWGIQRSLQFAGRLRDVYPGSGVVITSDPTRANEIANAPLLSGIFYFPTRSQLELVALVRESKLVVTPDTAVTHIASAEMKPTIALSYRENEWYPFRVPNRIIMKPETGSVADIPVDQVVEAALELIASNAIAE